MIVDHRALYLSRDQAEALELGARACRTLAAVEHAHILGDEEAFDSILAGVDPIEVKLTANALDALVLLWRSLPSQLRGGTPGVHPDDETSSGSILPSHVTAAPSPPGDGEQSPAPIPLHEYSKRVPCA